MKKQKLPRLRLRRETIQTLELPILPWVAGDGTGGGGGGATVAEICGTVSGECPPSN